MQVYNVEFFDKDYNYVGHALTEKLTYTKDYLSVQKNSINIPDFTFEGTDKTESIFYVKISAEIDIVGVVCGVNTNKDSYTVTFKDLTSIFNTNVKVDTNDQGVGTLEAFLKRQIEENYLYNSDSLQNIPGLSVVVNSGLTGWGFNFKSDHEGMHTAIVNLLENIIIRSFKKYRVTLTPKIDFLNKRFTVIIEQINDKPLYLESDLENVIKKRFSINKNEESANKLVIYNSDNYDEKVIYFLHPSGKFDSTDKDRLTPVVPKVTSIVPIEDFKKEAKSQAYDTFTDSKYNHFIELECTSDFSNSLELGQRYKIIKGAEIFDTVLTGFTISNTVKMKFGNARVKLSKILERSLKV